MRIAMFDTHRYEREPFDRANASFGHEIDYFEARLERDTAALARGHEAVCSFVNDRMTSPRSRCCVGRGFG
jgi:D-lactate dehydrogenase